MIELVVRSHIVVQLAGRPLSISHNVPGYEAVLWNLVGCYAAPCNFASCYAVLSHIAGSENTPCNSVGSKLLLGIQLAVRPP